MNGRIAKIFFVEAAKTMRRLLIDYARSRKAEKRGGGDRGAPLEEIGEHVASEKTNPRAIIELGEVLSRLEIQHPDVFKVFDLHYFMNYELKEIADDILDVSYTTVRRRWQMARAFLRRELIGDSEQ